MMSRAGLLPSRAQSPLFLEGSEPTVTMSRAGLLLPR
jgi:hypothetical protein